MENSSSVSIMLSVVQLTSCFDSIKIESNDHNRRAYRDMLFTTKGIEEAISGVILFDETIRTAALDGTPFPQLLSKKGIMPGIKVDKGRYQFD